MHDPLQLFIKRVFTACAILSGSRTVSLITDRKISAIHPSRFRTRRHFLALSISAFLVRRKDDVVHQIPTRSDEL